MFLLLDDSFVAALVLDGLILHLLVQLCSFHLALLLLGLVGGWPGGYRGGLLLLLDRLGLSRFGYW